MFHLYLKARFALTNIRGYNKNRKMLQNSSSTLSAQQFRISFLTGTEMKWKYFQKYPKLHIDAPSSINTIIEIQVSHCSEWKISIIKSVEYMIALGKDYFSNIGRKTKSLTEITEYNMLLVCNHNSYWEFTKIRICQNLTISEPSLASNQVSSVSSNFPEQSRPM